MRPVDTAVGTPESEQAVPVTAGGSPYGSGATPTSRAAFKQRMWGAVGSSVLGTAGTAFVLITLPRVAEREGGRYPAALVAFSVVAVWWGLVVLPREARLLSRPGSRREVVGIVGDVRRRWWLHPFKRVEERGWLIVAGTTMAIPVSPSDARRLQQPMDALIRGNLKVGRRVVVEFGDEVFFPTGRVVNAAELAYTPRS